MQLTPMNAKEIREAICWALLLTLLSWASVHAGIALGQKFVAPGPGYMQPGSVVESLFRFDSVYYKSIAELGYRYNGDPGSSPNLGFAPLFPLMVNAVGRIAGMNVIEAGFVLNKILLFLAFAFFYLVLKEWIPRTRALIVLFALATAAGSYAFHAYYSESTMLFLVGLALLCYQRRWFWGVGLSVAALGASRLAAFPMAMAFSVLLGIETWQATGLDRLKRALCALLCLVGTIAYLAFIGSEFGNPFILLDNIQKTSWGRFHQNVDWQLLLTGKYLINYWHLAIDRGVESFGDIRTLNLVWMTLGLLSGVYMIFAWRRHVLTYVFLPYLLFVYYANCSSEFLISTHRFFTSLPAIFLMMSAIPTWLTQRNYQVAAAVASVGLLIINLIYGWQHTAKFNQGVWFWF